VNTDIAPGQKIFLRLRGTDRTFGADVLEVASRGLTISTPRFREVPLDLASGDEVVVVYAVPGARFIYETTILAAGGDGRYTIGPPAGAVPVQERANVRQAVQFAVELADAEGRRYAVTAVNLSSGGLQVLSDRAWAVGTEVRVKLTLPRDFPLPIEVKAVVVWAERVLEEGRLVSRLGLSFVGAAIWQQDEIFRYIFRRMVEDRQLRVPRPGAPPDPPRGTSPRGGSGAGLGG